MAGVMSSRAAAVPMGIPCTMPVNGGRQNRDDTPIYEERNYTITGITKDSGGTPIGAVTVRLFNSATNALEQTTISDGSGNYSFIVDKNATWFVVAYLAGAPDTAGTTVRNLAGE